MIKHTIRVEDFRNYEAITQIAIDTKTGRMLCINVHPITNKTVYQLFKDHEFVKNLDTLSEAIVAYNEA